MKKVKSILRQIHVAIQILPTSRRKMLHERLRLKVAEDITSVMGEKGISIETLAGIMKLRKSELRDWIWTRDLKLSELVRLLDHLDSELYPIISPRKLQRNA